MKRQPTSIPETTLRLIVDGTASETGTGFFRALVHNLCQALGTLGAWVTEYLPADQKLRSCAMWMGDAFVDEYTYPLAGTACADVIESRKLVHIPERLLELYPQDTDLVPLNAMSYLGMPLLDTDGKVLGHLGVLDNQPMPRDQQAIALFEIFAARAAAEMRRLVAARQLRQNEHHLSQLLTSMMDAVIVIDANGIITRINPSAERMFNCTAEDLIGEPVREFLTPVSAAQFDRLSEELASKPVGRQQLWVPQDFVVRRWDHSIFPAEATLSRFESGTDTFITLLLRNADERHEAENQLRLLMQETESLRDALRELPGPGGLIGSSPGLLAVIDAVHKVAATDSTVLIHGETGTGKELVARSIHDASPRAGKPLVMINCAAIPANLIESEFFGHERGAFTGALTKREGRFSLANGGSIFLDEIGELPLEVQAKLLRVLQEGEIQPLGSSQTQRVDVRVIAATHRNLKQMIAEGQFREDLYFRLNVFPIEVPPLRERGSDIGQLAAAFTQRFSRKLGRRIAPLNATQIATLNSYDWPGNIRELQNIIERAVILSTGTELALDRAMAGSTDATPTGDPTPQRILTAAEMTELERLNLQRALTQCHGRISGPNGAAQLIGIPASTFSSRLKALGIQARP